MRWLNKSIVILNSTSHLLNIYSQYIITLLYITCLFFYYTNTSTLFTLDFFLANFFTLLIMAFLVALFIYLFFLELESIPSPKENQSCIAHFS